MNELVSIITPCYNGEKFVGRFIESILSQSYDNIEFIIINDGSTDNTEEVILSYRERFRDRGYSFIYLKQSNAGQSAAINRGLEVFSGDYLSWLDSDDYLPDYAIQKKVEYLNSNIECGTVISKIQVVDEGSLEFLNIQERNCISESDTIFYDLILGKNVFYTPGGYMVRTTMFRNAMPKPLKIEAPREIGQNFQLLLPIVYKYPVGYIDDICYYYVIRSDSHSHSPLSYSKTKKKIEISYNVLKKITNGLTNNPSEIDRISYAIEYRIFKFKLENILTHKKKEDLESVINEMNQRNIIIDKQLNDIIKNIKFPPYGFLVRAKRVVKRLLK